MIKYSVVGSATTYSVEQFKFPAGEIGVKLTSRRGEVSGTVRVTAFLQNSDDIMALLLTVDALRREHPKCNDIELTLPYIPYARQDRVCNEGESLSISVMASLINSCDFSRVYVYDPHSDVAPALIKNCTVIPQEDIFSKLFYFWDITYIVAPDAGAYKKAHKFASKMGAAGVIVCNKIRDTKTGKITGLSCSEDVTDKVLFVLDDICDGGRTFIEVSNLLRGKAASIFLGVTHGIFSKGVDVVADAYDGVYTTNSFCGVVPEEWNDKISVLNMF